MPASHTVVAFCIPLVATTLALLAFAPLARLWGWVDHPRGRRDHATATPLAGGLGILFGIVVAWSLGLAVSADFPAFLLSACVLLIAGIADDLHDMRWPLRMLAQGVAALVLIYAGDLRAEFISVPGDPAAIHLGVWAIPFTIFIMIGIVNAISIADGADGLVGGISLTSLLLLGIVCALAQNDELLNSIVIMSGAIGGFLVMNLRHPWQRRARIFLGSSGSAIVGLSIAWLAIRITQTPAHPVSSILAPWLVAPPLIDCIVLMAHRCRAGRSPFSADRNHLHHLLLDAGYSPMQVALLLAAVTALFGVLALAATYIFAAQGALVLIFLLLTCAHYIFTDNRERAVSTLRRLNWRGTGRPNARDAANAGEKLAYRIKN